MNNTAQPLVEKTPEQRDAGERCSLATGSALWAVSVVLTLHKPDGRLNVLNHLQRVRAANKDEAVGTAIRVSMEQCPEHQVHCYTALQFADEPNVAYQPRGKTTTE